MHFVNLAAILTRLNQFQEKRRLPGLETRESQSRFVEKLFHSEKKLRALSMRKFAGGVDPSRSDFHPLRTLVELFENARQDEALWLAFLTTHFGQDEPETVRLFYGRLGAGCWEWDVVKRNPESLHDWMRANSKSLKQLRFGSHRKRRIMDPEHARGTWTVIHSFVDWIEDHGKGSPHRAFAKYVLGARSPEEAFDCLYRALDIFDFGRTAKFDFLCLLGNLRILDISPGHCYLKGATGPKQGALLMVTGCREGNLNPSVENTIRKLVRSLAVPVESMEDALCNWQKHPKSKKNAVAQAGYLTTTCC